MALWPSPEVGVAMRYSPGSDYTGLPLNLQPVDRSLVPLCRSAPGASIQACCVTHGCLGHWLGSHIQWPRSVRGMDGSSTALAYQLPQVASSTSGPDPPQGRLQVKDVLVPTDNTVTFAYFNRQCGLRSRRMSQLTRYLILWSQKHLRSLRAIHIPEVFN